MRRDVSSRDTVCNETTRRIRLEKEVEADWTAPLRGPLVLAALCAAPLVLWARAAPLGQPLHRLLRDSDEHRRALRARRNVGIRAQPRARRTAAAGRGALRRPRPHVHGASPQRPGRVRAAARPRPPHPREPGHDLTARPRSISLGAGAGWTVFAGVLAFAAMTIAIVLTLFVRVGHEVFVYVQRTFGFVFLGATYHVFTTDGAKAQSSALNRYLAVARHARDRRVRLPLACSATCSCGASVPRHAVNRLDDVVTEIVMEPRGRPLVFAPGQFVFVNFRSLALQRAAASVRALGASDRSSRSGPARSATSSTRSRSRPRRASATLRVTVKAIGDYTRALRRLEPGAERRRRGPVRLVLAAGTCPARGRSGWREGSA